MTDNSQSLLRLMTWLSPVFPTGGFSYSHALESAIDSELVDSRIALFDWITGLITHGSIWNDCVLLVQAYGNCDDEAALQEVSDLCKAMAGSSDRYLETIAQGNAFMQASKEWQEGTFFGEFPLPIAIGALAGKNKIALETTLVAFLQAFSSNQIQCALRLMKLGQQNGVWVQKQLEKVVLGAAQKAATSTLDDLGSASIGAEICAMQHEEMNSRIFRT